MIVNHFMADHLENIIKGDKVDEFKLFFPTTGHKVTSLLSGAGIGSFTIGVSIFVLT